MIRVSVGVSASCRVGGSDTISFKDVIGFLCLNVDNGRQTDRLNIATAGKTARTCFWRRLPAQQRNSDDIVSLWSVQLRTVKCTPVWTGDGERTSNNLKNGIVHLQHTHTHTHTTPHACSVSHCNKISAEFPSYSKTTRDTALQSGDGFLARHAACGPTGRQQYDPSRMSYISPSCDRRRQCND